MNMVRTNVFYFQEEIAMVKLPANSIIKYKHTMFAYSAPWSLISYQDVHANSYHLSITILDRLDDLVLQ